jgi:hypothetical protein
MELPAESNREDVGGDRTESMAGGHTWKLEKVKR